MAGYVVRILGLAGLPNRHTIWDNQFVRSYALGAGFVGGASLVTTTNLALALHFPDQQSAENAFVQVDPNHPWRWDGKPNCGKTLVDVSIEPG